jgi:Protein of unknown function (DUF3037)
MSLEAYSYCVVRYSPDPGAGEALNIGVIIVGQRDGELLWRFESRFERLSEAFAGFAGKPYRNALSHLNYTLDALKATHSNVLLAGTSRATSPVDVLRKAVIDGGLSFQVSDQCGGVTADLQGELALLFDRMITSRRPDRTVEIAHRTNEQIWDDVFAPVLPPDVRVQLHAKKITTPDVEVEFEHAFKNGAWHLFQPVSLDYKQAVTIRKRASEWAGHSIGLAGASEVGKVYFLLGEPRHAHLAEAYEKAVRLLDKAPVPHRIVRERDAEEFAETVSALVRHEV